jgi:hypothetical protein
MHGRLFLAAVYLLAGASLATACASSSSTNDGGFLTDPGAGGDSGDAGSSAAGGDQGPGGASQGGAGNKAQGGAGSGQAGKGNAGSGNAGSGNAGSGKGGAGQGQAGSGQAGKGTAGQGQAGSGPKGACCSANDTPGCSDSAIEACVCAKDASCCSTSWNALCVAEVGTNSCGSCNGGAGAGGTGAAGSSNPFGGGGAGSGQAGSGNAGSGAGGSSSGTGDCCSDHPGFGCSNPTIEACVCNIDTDCCDPLGIAPNWDILCVNDVETFGCGSCGGGSGGSGGGGSQDCSSQPDATTCGDCCKAAHPAGYDAYNKDVGSCACDTACMSQCKTPCGGGSMTNKCSTCLQAEFGGPSCPTTNCDTETDCKPFVACLNTCPP